MSIVTDSGIAIPVLGGTVSIVGGSNITTSAAGNVVTVSLIASPILTGPFISGAGQTITTGDLTISAGNLNLSNSAFIFNAASRCLYVRGTNNIFIGIQAGSAVLTTATRCTAAGRLTQGSNITGTDNTTLGRACGNSLSGSFNTAMGAHASFAQGNASSVTSIGVNSNNALTTAPNATAIGTNCFSVITTGQQNLGLGAASGSSYTTTDNSNIAIMYAGNATNSRRLTIGTQGAGAGQVNKAYLAGVWNSPVGVGSAAVFAQNLGGVTAGLGTIVSSARFKDNIEPMDDVSTPINNLRPVIFTLKNDPGIKCFGLIAEEVHEVMPSLVLYDEDGQPLSVGYHRLPTLILNEMIKRAKVIASLKDRIIALSMRLRSA